MKGVRIAALLVGLVLLGTPLRAEEAPDAELVVKAAEAFDEGRAAYLADKFEMAASYFEAADAVVPSIRALRMAIRARAQAGHDARAATLAGQALHRYPDHARTRQLAEDTIKPRRESLHRLDITCAQSCIVAIGARAVVGKARKRWTCFVDPGQVTVSASFAAKQGSDRQVVEARAGASNALTFYPKVARKRPPSVPSTSSPDSPDPTLPEPIEPDDGANLEGESVAEDGESSWIASPGVFIGLAAATAVVGGVAIWSGVDTINEPGADAVRAACVGLGSECPEYQEGRSKQTRTNILIGASVGGALLTGVFGALVTDWEDGGGEDSVETTLIVGPQEVGIGLGRRF